MTENSQKFTGFEIAIIGMACRFPGSRNWREYWENLVNEVESVRFLSEEEIAASGVDRMTIADEKFVKMGSYLKRKELFDASFFNYRPDDATLLNPAHRVFHECVWEALEDAGYDPDRAEGLIGLFAGAGDDLNWKIYSAIKNHDQRVDQFTLNQINNKDYLASLLSYKIGLKGPAFSINTACSTSLVAIHLACKSLLMGEARMTLAGGVSINTYKQKGYTYEEGMIQSPDGHCRAFDKQANGTINGEGAGVVVLKRLKNAISDGDQVYAVIKGSAINNDGNRKVGYTAPSIEGQLECIRMAQKISKVDPSAISYIEAHGTGTRLGDPIEIEALNMAFNNEKIKHCALGSVKTNIGHLDTAAGVAGLIKTALCLKYRKIPPTLHFKEPNPEIDFEGGPFYINTTVKEWTHTDSSPRRAGVSSFGIGGTNAHVILEEAPLQEKTHITDGHKILTFSARTEHALNRYLSELKHFLDRAIDINLSDMAYTLQLGRKPFEFRKYAACKNREELIQYLDSGVWQGTITKSKASRGRIVFMFPGQGSQYVNMGQGLYEKEVIFRQVMDEGFSILKELVGFDLKEVLYSENEDKRINETRYAQPLLFLLEYSLTRLMISIGVTPQYMIGHSIGEYVAACISGVFRFEDALRLVVIRGRLMYNIPRGSMLSVPITEKEAEAYLDGDVSLAAINSPEQVVFSGHPDSIGNIMHTLDESSIPYSLLHTSHAFHSSMQDSVLEEFGKELQNIPFGHVQTPFISNLTGAFVAEKEVCQPDYWVRHMRETVQFSSGIATLLAQGKDLSFIEIGAGHSLARLVKQQPGGIEHTLISLVRNPREAIGDDKYLADSIGRLWSSGIPIDWTALYKTESGKRISLPTYSFEDAKYPVEVDPLEIGLPFDRDKINPAGNHELKDWIYYPIWKNAVLTSPEPIGQRRGYLFFSWQDNFTNAVRQKLVKEQDEWVEIIAGEHYCKESRHSYIINPTDISGYERLFEELQHDRIHITDIVHCWTIGVEPAELQLDATDHDINLVYFSLVHIVKSSLHTRSLSHKRITIITDRLYDVTGNEVLSCTSSLIIGLMNALPQEYSVTCQNIDVNLSAPGSETWEMIANEIRRLQVDRIVAIRNDKRWVQDYQRNAFPLAMDKTVIDDSGVCLVTGGTGNVGQVLVKYLTHHHKTKVVVLGRKPPVSIHTGNGVFYYQADVSLIDELEKAVTEIESVHGPIQGVVHAAGITDHKYFELVEDISVDNTLALFAPKVNGIRNIYKVFKDRQPNFVWITSSLSSVLGGLGYASYAAANLYMDHFILARSKELKNWKSIQLSEMLFSEESIERERNTSRTGLRPDELSRLFEWSLSQKGYPVILETVENLFYRINKVYREKKTNYLDTEFADKPNEKANRPDLANKYIPPEKETEKIIVQMVEDFFGFRNIGIADNFFELGGDSLKAMVFLKRMEQTFKIKFMLDEFFNAADIRQICDDIDEKLWINKINDNHIVPTA